MGANRASSASLLGWRLAFGWLLGFVLIAPWVVPGSGIDVRPVIWPIPEDPVQARKARLVNDLLPLIRNNNRKILKQREKAERLLERHLSGKGFSRREQAWLAEMGEQYRLPAGEMGEDWLRLLLRRLDIIPADLALAQAALESAWGESRFALEGNNYFGHWCFEPGCGLVPSQRPDGALYEVAAFDSTEQSVRRYMLNLNTHPGYLLLRQEREQLRAQGDPVTGAALADGLLRYSTRGERYVRTIRELIRSNGFDQYDSY